MVATIENFMPKHPALCNPPINFKANELINNYLYFKHMFTRKRENKAYFEVNSLSLLTNTLAKMAQNEKDIGLI